MDKYEETFETWNNIAALYEQKFMGLDLYNDTYDYICNAVSKPHATLLEIGCGPGNIAKYLLSKRPDFDILGIDIAPNMVELAKKNNPTANFAVMDSRQISTLHKKYDAIVCGFALPYLSPTESQQLMLDAYDLLYEGGLLYLSFVAGDPTQSDFKVGSGGRVFFYFHDLNELKKQLSDAGFDNIITYSVEHKRSEAEMEMHTIVTATKKTTA